jgi:hypothetical protein
MGLLKAKESMNPKVAVWPALMTEPNTSFHPFFQGLQHALRPYRAFNPPPSGAAGLCSLYSRLRHLRCSILARNGLHPSTFLHPFAQPCFQGFFATTGALTAARPAPCRPSARQFSLLHTARASLRSATNHLTRPIIAFWLPAQRNGLLMPVSPAPRPRRANSGSMPTSGRRRLQSGLRPFPAGSSLRPAESCSSSCGPQVRLQLLSTPPRVGAVTFSYQERASPERGLAPLCSRLLAGALGAASCRDLRSKMPLSQKNTTSLEVQLKCPTLCVITHGFPQKPAAFGLST